MNLSHVHMIQIGELLVYVDKCCDARIVVEISLIAFNTCLNLLSNTILLLDLVDHGSNTMHDIKNLTLGIMEEAGNPNLSDHFPILSKVDQQGIRRWLGTSFEKMFEIFDHVINQRLHSHGNRPRNDVLDILLEIMIEKREGIDRNGINNLLLVSKFSAFFYHFDPTVFSFSFFLFFSFLFQICTWFLFINVLISSLLSPYFFYLKL